MRPQTAEILARIHDRLAEHYADTEKQLEMLMELYVQQMQRKTAFAQQIGISAKGELLKIREFLAGYEERLYVRYPTLLEHTKGLLQRKSASEAELSQTREYISALQAYFVEFNTENALYLNKAFKRIVDARKTFSSVQSEFIRAKMRVLQLECEKRQLHDMAVSK